MDRITYIILSIALSACSFRHIGCLGMYEGQQVKLLKYINKGIYQVCPENDTTVKFLIDERDLE